MGISNRVIRKTREFPFDVSYHEKFLQKTHACHLCFRKHFQFL